MNCQKCGAKTFILDSRPVDSLSKHGGGPIFRRRHTCKACGHRVTTYELTAEDLDALVDATCGSQEILALIAAVRNLPASLPEGILLPHWILRLQELREVSDGVHNGTDRENLRSSSPDGH